MSKLITNAGNWGSQFAEATKDSKSFRTFLMVEGADPTAKRSWYNHDLLPSPPERRKYNWLNYFSFYISATFAPSAYNLGATLVANGLVWWQCLIAAVIGAGILTVLLVTTSRGPSLYYVGFPSIIRSVAGMYGGFWWIFIRASVATIYFATQTYYAGKLMSVALRCIFGHKWWDIPNHLPESAGISSRDLLGFFIYWMIQFPFMFLHPVTVRNMYTFKAFYVTISLFSVFGWCVHKAGGLGNIDTLGATRAHGSDLVWAELGAINSVLSALVPILINTADVSRYARTPQDSAWIQGFSILFSKFVIMFVACGTTSAAREIIGTAYWNVWDLYGALLDLYWTPGMRTGMFFASFGLMFAVLATNIGTNSLPIGADGSGLFPKYVDIRRGQVACALLCPLMVPWLLISSGTAFLSFLGSYSVLLCPMAACIIYDYYFIKRGNIHVPSLYDASETGIYHYYKGVNLRTVGAWIVGVGLTIHGVAGSIKPGSVGMASTNMFKIGFILSFVSSFAAYALLNYIFPVKVIVPDGRGKNDFRFEELAETEGYLEGESVETIIGSSIIEIDGERSSRESFTKDNIVVEEVMEKV